MQLSLLPPTELVGKTGQRLTIDGVTFEFQYPPDSEAPAEFTLYLPQNKAFCGDEFLSRNMHNLCTLKGAKVGDANRWSEYIIVQASEMFADSEVYSVSHHWPTWGKDNIQGFLRQQSDTYKYIHDQSVRLFNKGHTPSEVAEEVVLPDRLNMDFHNQCYCGTVKHNAKAAYQDDLGWYSANPAQLYPLPEVQSAKYYMSMMAGDTVLVKAQSAFDGARKRRQKRVSERIDGSQDY